MESRLERLNAQELEFLETVEATPAMIPRIQLYCNESSAEKQRDAVRTPM